MHTDSSGHLAHLLGTSPPSQQAAVPVVSESPGRRFPTLPSGVLWCQEGGLLSWLPAGPTAPPNTTPVSVLPRGGLDPSAEPGER